MTFHPFDDSYFQYTGNDDIHNIFGYYGAVCSDILFFLFGLSAYFLPCIMCFLIWGVLFKNIVLNVFDIMNKIFGGIILLFSLCGLAEFFIKEFYYCYSGGIVGFFLRAQIIHIFKSDMTINFILFLSLILGVVLLTPGFWWAILKKIMFIILNFFICCCVYLIQQCSRYDSKIFFSVIYKMCNNHLFNFFGILFRKLNLGGIRNFVFRYLSCRLNLDSTIFFNSFKLNNECALCDVKNSNDMNNAVAYHNNSCCKDYESIDKDCLRTNDLKFPINISSHIHHNNQLLLQKMVNVFPNIELLFPSSFKKDLDMDALRQKSVLLESKLAEYHIRAQVVNVLQGPVITRFELDLAPGLKSSRIFSLSRDLARSLSVCHLQVIEVIPGKPYVGVEIPNEHRKIVYLREILETKQFRSSCDVLTLGLGQDVSGYPVITCLSEMPHLLIAGTTGSGKSVGINSIIISILYKATPEDVRFIMIDPKMLELSVYNDIPHLLRNVVTDIKSVITVLNWCVDEMERRYKIMAYYGVRDLKKCNDRIKSYNVNEYVDSSLSSDNITEDDTLIKGLKNKLPYIVIIIDEFADLVMSAGKEIELLIIRLSQKSRACGIHLILATQRPSVNVITGLIKANIPSRIAFTVSSKIDSRTILDQSGAESLLGMGDMLYLSSCSSVPIRVHGAFVSDEEVLLVVKYLKNIFYK